MKRSLSLVALLTLSTLQAQNPWKNVYSERAWEERDAWQKPFELIRYMNIWPGSQVADIGCHEGYMTIKLSRQVGAIGKVYAVDVDQSRLDKLSDHLGERQLKNVSIVKGDYDNPRLPVNSLDAVIILDTYHEMDEHDAILQHISNSLRMDGRLVLCEPIADERRSLGREGQERRHELGIEYALGDVTRAGFEILHSKDRFVDRSQEKGDYMWLIVARKVQ